MTFDLHRTAAYGTLHNTADTLRAMLANAKSPDHPLELPDDVATAIGVALQWLFKAQREMEKEKAKGSIAATSIQAAVDLSHVKGPSGDQATDDVDTFSDAALGWRHRKESK